VSNDYGQAPGIGYIPFHQKLNEKFKRDYIAVSPERSINVEKELARPARQKMSHERGLSRIFLARKSFRHRRMVNHEEIEAIAAGHGFAIVYPEELQFPSKQSYCMTRAM
jgi:capsular polysaccharide biosynthesis protein